MIDASRGPDGEGLSRTSVPAPGGASPSGTKRSALKSVLLRAAEDSSAAERGLERYTLSRGRGRSGPEPMEEEYRIKKEG